MNTPPIAYGVRNRMKADTPLDEIIAEITINGFAIIDSGFPASFMQKMRGIVDDVYQTQVQEFGGEENLRKVGDVDIARGILAYDDKALQVATSEPLMELSKRILGSEFVLLQQNAILNRPERGNYQKLWHRDLSYQHWTCTQILSLSALFCVDEFTHENGATFVIPGSHATSEFPTEQFLQKFEHQIAAPAGSYIVMDAMAYHRAGVNRSQNVRRAINNVIGLPFLAQQINLPQLLASRNKAAPEDASLRKYLGYRWAPANTVEEWRSKKLAP